MAERSVGPLLRAWLLPGWTLRAAAGVAVGALLGIAAVQWAPVSPVALAQADLRYGGGDAEGAVAAYRAIARWHPLRSVRIAAGLRAADVSHTVLGAHDAARADLARLLDVEQVDGPPAAAAWARIGTLAHLAEGPIDEAIAAWRTALSLAPDAPDAAAWQMATARALGEAGRLQAALLAWDRVIDRHPAHADRAHLAQAALLLAADDVMGALEAYRAAAGSRDPTVRQVARLGAAATRARLGEVEGALADLRAAGLPDDVASARAEALQPRAAE